MEEWREVIGFEGVYEVSDKGNVRSLPRKVFYTNGRIDALTGRELKQHTAARAGYKTTTLRRNKKSYTVYVHRLVAEAFIPKPNDSDRVNHKDENRANNNVENLEWCNAKYNANYGSCRKKMSEAKQKPVRQIDMNGNEVAVFPDCRAAAKSVNGSFSNINKVCNEKKYRHTAYGYKWEFA